ncbi:MAG: preQ(1) synthase [Paracoccaceae bacterium]
MTETDVSGLSQLGRKVDLLGSPDEARPEKAPAGHAGTARVVRFTAPEFTSMCPMTGHPDLAHIVIDHGPGEWLVESKPLKLYLNSFRNHGAFHADRIIDIGKRLVELLTPAWPRIGGYRYPRGGIPIDVFRQTGAPPEGAWIPDQGAAPYRGRG